MREFLLLPVILTFLQFRQSQSFSVQKRHTKSNSDLDNALEVLRRKRRRIDDSNIRTMYGDLASQYLPYDEYVPGGYNEDDVEKEDLADQYQLAKILNSYQDQYRDDTDNTITQDQSSETETPTIEEIKEMFDEIDKNDAKDKVERSDSKPDKKSDKISQQQMDELLSEAAKVPTDNTKTSVDEKSKGNTPEPVSPDELKDVFKDTKTQEQQDDRGNANVGSISQEYVNNNQGNSLQKKKKRMAKRDNNSEKEEETKDEMLLNLVQEVQELRGKVAKLQLVEYLEDKENDYLASALKAATLAQLGKAEPYLEDEYGDIQKALDIEETLQAIKEATEGPEEDEEEPVQEVSEKRSQPPFEDNLGVWYDEPVPGQEQGDAQQKLEDFVKQYRQRYDVEDENENDVEDESIVPENMPVPVLPTTEDICPQLDLLTSNCEVASLLDIDDEARDLCNRHEVCYICGATVGLTQQDCDTGFRSETVERCRTSHCIQSGAEFLWFIKQDHKFTNSFIEQCDAACVKKYIVGE